MGFNKQGNSEVLAISGIPEEKIIETEAKPLEASPAKTSEVIPSSEKKPEETKN